MMESILTFALNTLMFTIGFIILYMAVMKLWGESDE